MSDEDQRTGGDESDFIGAARPLIQRVREVRDAASDLNQAIIDGRDDDALDTLKSPALIDEKALYRRALEDAIGLAVMHDRVVVLTQLVAVAEIDHFAWRGLTAALSDVTRIPLLDAAAHRRSLNCAQFLIDHGLRPTAQSLNHLLVGADKAETTDDPSVLCAMADLYMKNGADPLERGDHNMVPYKRALAALKRNPSSEIAARIVAAGEALKASRPGRGARLRRFIAKRLPKIG